MRLLTSALAAAAAGFLVGGCSGTAVPQPTRSGPAGSVSARTSSAPAALTVVTSSLAKFTMPSAVSRPIVYPAGEGLLVVGGLTAADSTTPSIVRVDLTAGTVRTTGQLALGVHDAGGAVVHGRDLLFGGGSTVVTSAVQDVTAGTASQVIGRLPQPRADLVAVSDASSGYVLAGFDGAQGSTTILRTRDGRTFTTLGSLPVSVRYPAAAVGGGSIWLFGGEHAGRQVTDVQRIDLTTGQASIAGQLPHPLAHAGAFTLGGAVFVAGGRTGATTTATILRFDPSTMRFTTAGHLPARRSDFGAAVVNGTAYLVGGENPKPVDTVIEVRAHAGAAR